MVYRFFTFSNTNNFFYKNPFIGVAAISLFFESVIFFFTLGRTFPTQWFIFGHSLVVLSLVFFVFFWRQSGKETYFPILFTISTAVLGALGAFFVLLLLLVPSKGGRVSIPELYESLLSGLKKTEQEDLFEHLISGNVENFDQTSVIPFMDVLHYGNQRQKQTMIALLINNYQRSFSPILKEAIKDRDNSIRVLASTGMAQIENQFMRRAIEIETFKKQFDGSNRKYLKALGLHYDDYAYCEILDEFQQEDIRNLAIKAYQDYLRFNPLDRDVLFYLCRALLRNGKPAEAEKNFEAAMKKKSLPPQAFVWYLESLYRLQEYTKLREVTHEYSRNLKITEGGIPTELNRVLNVWSPTTI